MKTFRTLSILFFVLAASGLATSCGCGGKDFKPSKIFSLDNAWPFDDDEDEPEEGIPVRIVGAWTDTVKTTPDQKPQRGFGGRLMFYDAEGEKPILVDGQLVVYAFDEAGRVPTDNKPTRRYVFPPDQMKRHMSKNEMGASYSFWLPWDEAGGAKADVSLICRFEPKGGAVITGEQTRHILPGSIPTESPATAVSGPPRVPEGVPMRPAQMTLEQYQAQQRAQSGVQTAGYETVADPHVAATAGVSSTGAATVGAAADGRQMSVTSIALPREFQIPEGTNPQPIATAGQVRPTQPAQQPVAAALYQQPQYQQPQYQQPAAPAQPAVQTVQPPAMNGAAVVQPMPAYAGQMQPRSSLIQRPVIVPINSPGMYVPQNQAMAAPITAPQYAAQQPMMQAAQPTIPQAQAVAMPTQPTAAMPAQQVAPGYPPGYQQSPPGNGLRTAVSYGPAPGPATVPWR